MVARTAEQYLKGLADNRQVWLGNEVVDVLKHPAFTASLKGMSGYFSWQHQYADSCLVRDPSTGQQMSASLIVPKNKEDLEARGKCYEQLAKYSVGMLGRTPDYVNTTLSGYVASRPFFEKFGHGEWADRLEKFHREVVEKDLSMTHTIIQPAIDKGIGDLDGINGEIALQVVGRTKNGVIVRGAKILATLGPFADELYVYPASPILGQGTEAHAISFSIPMGTPGLVTFCRDHYTVNAESKDLPFSSRFDEQDAVMFFDDVEVPLERVFIDGDIDFYNKVVGNTGWYGNVTQQTASRAAVKLEFAYDLCVQMAKITNSEKRPEVSQMLGELWTYATMTRAALAAGMAGAHQWENTGFFLDQRPLLALMTTMPQWMVRVNGIIKSIGSHNLLATPISAAFMNEVMAETLKKYVPGAAGFSAEDRAQIHRIAWDFVGSALGGRVELYERYYLGSRPRNLGFCHMFAQKNQKWGQVEDFLKNSVK